MRAHRHTLAKLFPLAVLTAVIACSEVPTGSETSSLTPSYDRGGRAESVRSCLNGGYQGLNNPATGAPFASQAECVRHGAEGGTFSSLVITNTVSDEGCWVVNGCWGRVTGTGLQPGSQYQLVFYTTSGTGFATYGPVNVDLDGNLSDGPHFGCPSSTVRAWVIGTTSEGATITSPVVYENC